MLTITLGLSILMTLIGYTVHVCIRNWFAIFVFDQSLPQCLILLYGIKGVGEALVLVHWNYAIPVCDNALNYELCRLDYANA